MTNVSTHPSAPGSAGGSNVPNVKATFVTTTSFGTWLPGDLRGYVQDGVVLPSNPKLLAHARTLLSKAPVYFTPPQIIILDHAIRAAADEFNYTLTDLSIESWHLHWIIHHGFDPVETMVGRLKTRMRQMIKRGRIWTAGYCHRCLFTTNDIVISRAYIARHDGCRSINGESQVHGPSIPRQSRGLKE